jgi:hypothetical protein
VSAGRRVALLLFASVLVTSAARAEGDEAEGRRRWRQGQELYQKGHYLEAAREFEAGYAVAPRPLFLLNIGHAYRRAQELVKARAAYEKLLQLQPDLPQRAEVEGYIKSIDDALQVVVEPATLAPAPAPTTAPPAPAPSIPALVDPGAAAAVAVPMAPMPALSASSPPPVDAGRSSGSVLTRPWFWVIVGAVVAGGVAAGVIALRPSTACPATSCIREN